MSADVTPPTLDQFLVASRAEFSFLADHGFREIPLPESRYTNPYSVLFERGDWRLRVEGLAYGFGAGLSVVAPDGREVPFIAPKAFREAHREGLGRGQVGELKF